MIAPKRPVMVLPLEPSASIEHPELFFALVGPAGAEMYAVANALEAELCAVYYGLVRGQAQQVPARAETLRALARRPRVRSVWCLTRRGCGSDPDHAACTRMGRRRALTGATCPSLFDAEVFAWPPV